MVFFAYLDQIRTDIDRGEFLARICRDIEFPGSYSQFVRYVDRYIGTSPRDASEAAKPQAPSSWSPIAPAVSAAPRRSERPTRQVKYDPNQLNREDVI